VDDCGTDNRSNGDAGFCRHGPQGLHVESLLEPTKRRRSILAFASSDLPNHCPITSVEQVAFDHEHDETKLDSEGTPALLVRLSACFAPSSNEMVSLKVTRVPLVKRQVAHGEQDVFEVCVENAPKT
jgi:hypothetical protein